MENQDLILKIKFKGAVGSKFTASYISNINLHKLQSTLLHKTKRWKKYIYKVHSLI